MSMSAIAPAIDSIPTDAARAAAFALREKCRPARCGCGNVHFNPVVPLEHWTPGRRADDGVHAHDGWWRCVTCGHGVYVEPPTAVAEAKAMFAVCDAEAAAATAAAAAERGRRRLFERSRDRRNIFAMHDAWHAALCHRAAPAVFPVTGAARPWLDWTLVDLAQRHLELIGVDPHECSLSQLARMALDRGDSVPTWTPTITRGMGYQATADFPGVLDGVVRAVFLDAFDAVAPTFQAWTTAITLNDFRSTYAVLPTFPALQQVPEHGEYTAPKGPLGPAEPVRLATYGKVLGFSRQAFLRDDVPGLAQLGQALAVAAAAVEADVVYGLLTSNPVMRDGQPLFSTQHANKMPAADLTAESLAVAASALAAQTGDGHVLHLAGRYLLVGVALGTQARQLIASATPADTAPGAGPLTVIEDSRIPGKDWYVTCDPRQRPTIVTAHLTATDGPELLVQDGWDIDARQYKGRDDFGAVAVDYRSMVLTPGT
jgi:hypothetical protein